MKAFLKDILLFSILLIVVFIIIISIPYSSKFAYSYLGGDYTKSAWNYKRIFEDTRPIDIAFLGTSRTLNSIKDSIIESTLKQKGLDVHVANIASKDIGRNLHYIVTRDLFENNHPQLLILEVREIESDHGHKYFSYMAGGKDILLPPLFLNKNLFSDLKNGVNSRVEYIRSFMGNGKSVNYEKEFNTNFGFEPNFEFVDSIRFREIVKQRNNRAVYGFNKTMQNIGFNYSKKYVKKIIKLSEKYNVKLVFLYIPYSESCVDKPMLYDFYIDNGEVWFPKGIYEDINNYANPTHLNDKGADKLTDWVAVEIEKMFSEIQGH